MELEKNLILYKFFLQRFDLEKFEDYRENFIGVNKNPAIENDSINFLNPLIHNSESTVLNELMTLYDENVRNYEGDLKINRPHEINLKYFQYLALMFMDFFLDQYFNYKEDFFLELNQFLDVFNNENNTDYSSFTENNFNKIAFSMATGCGKTLIFHINYWQIKKYSKDRWATIILITPNEGLSKQHYKELKLSGIDCKLYNGNRNSLKTKKGEIFIIDIHKLKGEKTGQGVSIDVSEFEGKNLVFIDEGHKGQKSEEQVWKKLREEIGKNGLIVEYSATFREVISKNKDLLEEYAKAILFDYSYKYFYEDGYGKDFYLFNLREDAYSSDQKELLITSNLLSYYEQLLIFEEKRDELGIYNIERPLWIFVGSKVSGANLNSDIVQVILSLNKILSDETFLKEQIDMIFEGDSGLVDISGSDIFKGKFEEIKKIPNILDDIYERIFYGKGSLNLYEIKNAKGEIALKASLGRKYFGLINIGDVNALEKVLNKVNIGLDEDQISHSIFYRINEEQVFINILIGSRKFIEGWDSWRVSNMGLINIGKGEGPLIIQLFGRGVRLKGKDYSLKRERIPPRPIKILQTLNIFGLNANYMKTFLEIIQREGVSLREFTIPIVFNSKDKWENKLYTIDSVKMPSFNKNIQKLTKNEVLLHTVRLDLRPKITHAHGLIISEIEAQKKDTLELIKYFPYFDWEKIYLNMLSYKVAKHYYNLVFDKATLKKILESQEYKIYKLPNQMEITSFGDLEKIQDLAEKVLKTYLTRYYQQIERKHNLNYLKAIPLSVDDNNLNFGEIIVKIPNNLVKKFEPLFEDIANFYVQNIEGLPSIHWTAFLYSPLVAFKKENETIKTIPAKLNFGETRFIRDLRAFVEVHEDFFEDKELYVIRNLSKVGVGFYITTGLFFPDFIIWILHKKTQKIIFLDPKGLVFAGDFNNDKIQFCTSTIKNIEEVISEGLKESDDDFKLELFSFIICVSSYPQVKGIFGNFEHTIQEFEEHNVFFQRDRGHVGKIFEKVGYPTLAPVFDLEFFCRPGSDSITKARNIDSAAITISVKEENKIEAMIKNYRIEIDLEKKVILHERCDGFFFRRKGKKLFCKHLLKLFLHLIEEQSEEDYANKIIKEIGKNLSEWSFIGSNI